MKRVWLIAAAMAPLSFAAVALPQRALAQTTISNSTTTPVFTSTTGNLTITGSIEPASNTTLTPLAAVTIDSSNSVTNQGTISFSGGNLSTGILVNGNSSQTGLITNSGTIALTESTTGDGTNQGIANGPFANGAQQFGIAILGPGNFTGLADVNNVNDINVIDNSGSINVVGENSAGIFIGTSTIGGIFDSGSITVTGGNGNTTDTSYGIHATGPIGGNVTITGAISATGANATGVSLEQGLTGELLLQNAITATGYRTTTASNDPAVLNLLGADQLLQGGPALIVGGDVTGGIVLDVFRTAGNTTAANAAGVLTVYGSAPALLLGGTGAMTVGNGTNAYGLTIGGQVSGVGDFANFDGNGIQIGGDNTLPVTVSGVASGDAFGAVTIDNGIDVTGNVAASAVSIAGLTTAEDGLGSAATALHLGAGASTPLLNVSGSIMAVSAATGNVTPRATAIQIDNGATLSTLTNSGVISAAITGVGAVGNAPSSGGTTGTAIAINDESGSLTSITNTGVIAATITPIVTGQTVDGNATTIALNLANATGNVSVTQTADPSNINGITTPSITGDVIFGSGNATLNLFGGNLTGDTTFGTGADNLTIGLGNVSAIMKGGLTQAAGGTLNIAVDNGVLFMTNTGVVTVPTLTVGGAGTVVFSADPGNVTPSLGQFQVTGNATFDAGSKVGLNLLSKLDLPGNTSATFVVVQGIGGGDIESSGVGSTLLGQIPYLYHASDPVVNAGVDGNVSITLTQKSPTGPGPNSLGLNPAEAAAYPYIFAAFDRPDSATGALPPGAIGSIKDALLNADTESSFKHLYDQFLPDYGGGVFETFADGQQSLARAEADAPTKLQTDTTRGWVQEIGYFNNENASASVNGFSGQGFGIAAGVEAARGNSAVGLSAAFLSASVQNGGQTSDGIQAGSALEAGVYMRAGDQQGLKINASLNGGLAWFSSRRLITQESQSTTTTPASTDPATGVVTPATTTTTDTVSLWRQANANWIGAIMSADFGLSYQVSLGKRFYVRPEAAIDYALLYEAAHTETGGGNAFDLHLAARTSQQATVQGDLVFGANLGDAIRWQPEVTLGWRQIVVGGPGSTTASFASGGGPFTLSSSFTQKSGLLGRIGIHASSAYADFSADAGGVFSSGYQTYDARAVARFLF